MIKLIIPWNSNPTKK